MYETQIFTTLIRTILHMLISAYVGIVRRRATYMYVKRSITFKCSILF